MVRNIEVYLDLGLRRASGLPHMRYMEFPRFLRCFCRRGNSCTYILDLAQLYPLTEGCSATHKFFLVPELASLSENSCLVMFEIRSWKGF